MSKPKKIICNECDLVLEIPEKKGRLVGYCPRCHNLLHHYHYKPSLTSLCYALAALCFLVPADIIPFMSIRAAGIEQGMEMLDYTSVLGAENMWSASVIIYLFMQLLPALTLLTIIIADIGKIKNIRLKIVPPLLKLYHFCTEWSMVEVFMVGILVSLIKLVSLVEITYHYGFWSFFAFAILYLLAVSRFSTEEMWDFYVPEKDENTRELETGIRAEAQDFVRCTTCGASVDIRESNCCKRCGTKVKDKSTHSISKCMALVFAAIIMYIPANIYPMMITTYLGSSEGSTVIDGVIVLWQMKSYFVASVILIASICIPVLKIAMLIWLCLSVKRLRRTRRRRYLAVVYRVVEFIGKWSMVDVFVVAIMTTIVRIQNLMTIYPGSALLSFASVVILTMLAAREFDPRLLWGYKVS